MLVNLRECLDASRACVDILRQSLYISGPCDAPHECLPVWMNQRSGLSPLVSKAHVRLLSASSRTKQVAHSARHLRSRSLTGESILRAHALHGASLPRYVVEISRSTSSRGFVQFLSLDFIWFVVVIGDGTDGIAVYWNRAVSCVCLQRVDDRVLVRISVSGCNVEGVVLLVRVSWCKGWSLHACPPSFARKLKTIRRVVFARFLRITDEHYELLGKRRDEHFILHVRRELLLHEVQLPCSDCQPLKLFSSASSDRIRNLSSSSSCVLRWALSPAADSSSVTRLVRNSFTGFDVLCTRLQLFLLHGLNQTAGALPVCCACFGTDTAHDARK